jgi:hypothetical protein
MLEREQKVKINIGLKAWRREIAPSWNGHMHKKDWDSG